jgi:hypothetical protein
VRGVKLMMMGIDPLEVGSRRPSGEYDIACMYTSVLCTGTVPLGMRHILTALCSQVAEHFSSRAVHPGLGTGQLIPSPLRLLTPPCASRSRETYGVVWPTRESQPSCQRVDTYEVSFMPSSARLRQTGAWQGIKRERPLRGAHHPLQ